MQKIIIFKELNDLQRYCADQFIAQVKAKPDSRIGFATGVSPVAAYKMCIEDHKQNGTSWKDVVTFNLDEFVGIDPNHRESFAKQMRDNLFNHIDVQEENINIPNCQAADPAEEARKYEETIRTKGPIDFQYISLGVNGHMAYNEPGTSLDSLTHVATLTPETIVDMVQKGKFVDENESPKQAITMGVKTLLETTKKMIMISYGAHKAEVTRIMIEDTPNTEVTASALQNHPDCTYILDATAAANLSEETLKHAEWR